MRVGSAVAVVVALAAIALGGCLGSGGSFFGGGVGPKDYLTSKTYTKWVIELDAVQGQAPSASVLNALRSRLDAVVNKPAGVEIASDETSLPAHGGAWSDKDVADFEAAHKGRKTEGSTVTTHLLFVDGNSVHDGESGSDNKVLGIAYGHETIILFSEVIRASCSVLSGCLTSPDYILQVVLVHEFGHALGLVNNGIYMSTPHEDGARRAHSSNCDSVMFWSVETTAILRTNCFGRTTPPTDYDATDKADLCKAGGKC